MKHKLLLIDANSLIHRSFHALPPLTTPKGEPINAVLLMGLGLRSFSLSAPNIPRVKEAIRSISLAQANEIGERVLRMESAQSIRSYLEAAQRDLGL